VELEHNPELCVDRDIQKGCHRLSGDNILALFGETKENDKKKLPQIS
jgi:hypothetical protein